MESVQDPGGSLSKALGNCWETTPADGAQMDVDLTDAETPQQKIYLAMIDCLLETPRNPLNKIGYQYRIAENIHRAVFSIWWYLQVCSLFYFILLEHRLTRICSVGIWRQIPCFMNLSRMMSVFRCKYTMTDLIAVVTRRA